MMATQNETEAGVMLLNKNSVDKATVHFDTTSRSNIDGDWPTIILRFSNNISNTEFRLRPILFAYEDREQITKLFIESFNRFADAVSISETKTITPAMLWDNVDAIMTDAITKKFGNRRLNTRRTRFNTPSLSSFVQEPYCRSIG